MEVITIEKEAFQRLLKKLDSIEEGLEELRNPVSRMQAEWVDTYDVMKILKVSRRTVTQYVSEGKLKCSRVKNKNYFKLSEIEEFLRVGT